MYKIDGLESYKKFNYNKINYPNFQNELQNFKNIIINAVKNNKSLSYIHFGDGDYFFLKKQSVGSATPGKRALSISYDKIDMQEWKQKFLENEYYCVEILHHGLKEKFLELFPNKQTIPTDFIYGLTISKWFFTNFKNQVGLIGGKEKLNLIKKLMDKREYQEYIGCDYFSDYISIPQKFAVDNVDELIIDLNNKLKNTKSKIFLYGVGHVKSKLISSIRNSTNAVFIDIGAGIDAIAGLYDKERPFGHHWINHRIKDFDYSKIDLMNYNYQKDKTLIYL